MPLYAHRSQRTEDLVRALARVLEETWPEDPLLAVPLVVGSREMARWLRHELATRFGGIAGIEPLFPRAAFERAAAWLLDPPRGDPTAAGDPFRRPAPGADEWTGMVLAVRVLAALRARPDDPTFAHVHAFLGEVGDTVGARELSFARDVASCIERLLHDRPLDVLDLLAAPGAASDWVSEIVRALHRPGAPPSPAERVAQVRDLPPAGWSASLHVFGLSTLRPGDMLRFGLLARHLDVHVYALAPSSAARRGRPRHDATPEAAPEPAAHGALLASSLGPSQDLERWFEAEGSREPSPPPPPRPRASTLLERVQTWLDAGGQDVEPCAPEGAPWSSFADCPSLEIHACHSPLRQCEVLRDELLRRFAADPTLEPRHVLVLAPDVACYAPLLAAVLARRDRRVPSVPVHVSDLGVRATNPVAEALLRALALADERVEASGLLELLALSPVRERFGCTEEDVVALRRLVVESGMRWGWDAEDRARHGQPPLDQNTVRFGLERLALGLLLHDPGGLGVLPAPAGAALAPAVPLEIATREGARRFGVLAELCTALRDVARGLSAPATAATWRARLQEALDALTRVEGSAAWLRTQVDETIAELLPDVDGEELVFEHPAVAAALAGAFELPRRGERPAHGAVTIAALEPMRSVPFRVIAVLGLDDGAFPRETRAASFDPFAAPRAGELDRRAVDRHLFLEAILCARDALLLFGNGFEPRRGAPVPLSDVLTELAEGIGPRVGRRPEDVPRRHPLMPFGDAAFADPTRLPFDEVWTRAAHAARGARAPVGLAATLPRAAWPAEERPPRALAAEELARALAAPQRELLRGRLGLAVEARELAVDDREPLEQDSLDTWRVRERILRAHDGGGVDVAAIEARLRGEGALPLEAGGRLVLEAALAEVRAVRKRLAELPGTPADALTTSIVVRLEGGEILLTAVSPEVRRLDERLELVWTTAGKKPNAKEQLTAWITALVARAAGENVHAARVIGCEGGVTLVAPRESAAAAALVADLVEVWREVRGGPVPLFPGLSRAIVERLRKDASGGGADAVRGAARAWIDGARAGGNPVDPWFHALFGGCSADDLARRADEIVAVASRVYGPLLDAVVPGGGRRGARVSAGGAPP